MKFKKAFALILALLCTVSLFSACGSADAEADINRVPSSPVMDKLTSESITEDSFYLEYADESYIEASKNNGLTSDSADGETNNTSSLQLGTPDPSRKLIYHVNYSLETKTFDSSVTSLLALTESLGGYTESSDTRGGNGSERYATYVLRIPSEKLTDFIAGVGNIGSILSESLSTEDVTLEYVDIESHLTSLRAQETRLLELLSEAKDLSEVLMIEESLTGVRYEIESYTTRLNTISSLVSYSTVTVSLREVIEYTPIVTTPLTFGDKLAREFKNSINRVWNGAQDFAIWFLGNIVEIVLVLAFIAVVVLVHVFVIKFIIRRCRRRK